MAELQKLTSYQLNDLPDEVILKVLNFLDIKELLLCGQVSQRLRAIANDESLWQKLNLCRGQDVPYDFIKKAVENGCQYLSLAGSGVLHLTEISEPPFNLKYLNMSQEERLFPNKAPNGQRLPKMVQNCNSLQKLSVATLPLDSDDIQYICQNGQTLQVLDMAGCDIDPCNLTNLLQDLFRNCSHLTELNISGYFARNILLVPHIQALVDNLTPTILKINLSYQTNLKDEHLKILVERCNKITHLDLFVIEQITNDSVQIIIKHLNTTLEKIDLTFTSVDYAALHKLKSMPKLKTLIICDGDYLGDSEGFENLKQQLPNISIAFGPHFRKLSKAVSYELSLVHVASPFKRSRLFHSYFVNVQTG